MNVTFSTFSKKHNSTARPGGLSATYDCIIKDGTSTLHAKIGLQWPGVGNPTAYNMCRIGAFGDGGKYYYIQNWYYEDRIWWCDCKVDVLATYKTYIGNANKYILRAASDHDPLIPDNMAIPKSSYVDEGALAGTSLGWANYGSGGTYVITVIGNNNATASAVCTQFQVSGSVLQTIINGMCNAVQGWYNAQLSSTTIREAVQSLFSAPFRATTDLSQYIKNVMWFPFEFPAGGGGNIYLGMFNTGVGATGVGAPLRMFSGSCNLPTYRSAEIWEYASPYGSYWFKMLPFGMFELDPMDVLTNTTIDYTVGVDSVSGLGTLTLSIGGRVIATRSAQIGIPVPYGGSSPNYAGAITAAAGLAEAIQSESGLSAGAIGNAILSVSPRGFSAGTGGGGGALEGVGHVYWRVLDHIDVDETEAGRPLCEMKTISSLSGFVLCRDGDISAPATASELAEIESYLTGGFFYE